GARADQVRGGILALPGTYHWPPQEATSRAQAGNAPVNAGGSGTGYALGAEHEVHGPAVQAASDRADLVLSRAHQVPAAAAAGWRGPAVPGGTKSRWLAAGDNGHVGAGATRAIRRTPKAPVTIGDDHRHEPWAHVEAARPAALGNSAHREAGRLARLIEVLRGGHGERHAATGTGARCRGSMGLPCGPVLRGRGAGPRGRRGGRDCRALANVRRGGARCSGAARGTVLARCRASGQHPVHRPAEDGEQPGSRAKDGDPPAPVCGLRNLDGVAARTADLSRSLRPTLVHIAQYVR